MEDPQKLQRLLDAERLLGRLTLARLIKLAHANGIALSNDEVWRHSSMLTYQGEWTTPPSVTELVVSLLTGVAAASVLDPWVGFGTMLRPVIEALTLTKVVGVHPNDEAIECARLLLPKTTDLRPGDVNQVGLLAGETFDVIISAPPFSARTSSVVLDGIELRGDQGDLIVLRSSLSLNPGGVGLFLVPAAFFFADRSRSVATHLTHFGLFIDAAFHLPSGTFRPVTGVESYILVLRRGLAPGPMFVASGASETRSAVISNYRGRRVGKEPALGILVDQAEFTGLPDLVAAHDLEQRTKRLGLPRQRLGDLCTSIAACPGDRDKIDLGDNAFFLELIGTFRVARQVSGLPPAPRGWVQIQVDPEQAHAGVLAGFLESDLGRLVLQSSSSGSALPRIARSLLPDLPVYLPDISQQRRILATDQRLRTLGQEALELRSALWTRMHKVAEVEAQCLRLNHEETFPGWLDTLPFPLASILWVYHTHPHEPHRQYLQAGHFFEATAQYLAVLLLSAARRDPITFDKARSITQQALESGRSSLDQAAFGTWLGIYQALAKWIRGQSKEEKAPWLTLLACGNAQLLEGLVNKKIVEILQETNHLRNQWQGHGGIVSDGEAQRRTQRYRELLAEFREVIGRTWAEYPLVQPGKNDYEDGQYHQDVGLVMGTRTPFENRTFVLKQPLDRRWLYLITPGLGLGCPLLPFIRLGPSPKEAANACYFYSRRQGQEFKFVSFHHEAQPDASMGSPDLQAFLTTLAAFPPSVA